MKTQTKATTLFKTPLTPMMSQYQRIKEQLPTNSLLMFRLGDFYEFFFDDATTAVGILKIALTNRNGMPMAGIPSHAKMQYISKLLKAGWRVAIYDMSEIHSGAVERKVTETFVPDVPDLDCEFKSIRATELTALHATAEAAKAMLEIMNRVFPNGLPVEQGRFCEEQDWDTAVRQAEKALSALPPKGI